MNEKLFSNGDDDNHASENPDNEERIESYRERYVGESKKYANDEEAFKALHYAQEHIKRLEEEARQTREELGAREALEDMIDKVMNRENRKGTMEESTPPQNNVVDEMSRRVNDAEQERGRALTKDEIERMVRETLHVEQAKTKFDRNIDEVAKTLENTWGPGYRTLMNEKAKELGVSPEYLANLAGESPKAFLAAVGVNTTNRTSTSQATNAAPPRSSTTTRLNSGEGDAKQRNWAHYQKMRKENPSLYYSPKMQLEMFERKKRGEI